MALKIFLNVINSGCNLQETPPPSHQLRRELHNAINQSEKTTLDQ